MLIALSMNALQQVNKSPCMDWLSATLEQCCHLRLDDRMWEGGIAATIQSIRAKTPVAGEETSSKRWKMQKQGLFHREITYKVPTKSSQPIAPGVKVYSPIPPAVSTISHLVAWQSTPRCRGAVQVMSGKDQVGG